jgi:hypothetical protein
VDNVRTAEIEPIETAFGKLEGRTSDDVAKLVIRILSDLRYVDIEETLRALGHIYQASSDAEVRKEVDQGVEELTRHDLEVWRQAGLAVQLALVSVIDGLTGEERNALWPLLRTVWRECLNTELRGTSWSADAISISSGAMPAVDDVKTLIWGSRRRTRWSRS